MQGTWKTKKKHIQKDKFDQIVKTIKYLNPIKFKKELSVDFLEEYKLKQSRCPNNSRKKIYKKIVNFYICYKNRIFKVQVNKCFVRIKNIK